jgi:LPPG:FO 2-phospho-L-lactate transferase
MRLDGIEPAAMTDAVRSALADADTIIIGPSNPWLSINPILSVPGMRDAIKAHAAPRVAVTPIVAGEAVKGPAAKIMAELGYNVSPETVVDFYGDVLNGFVYDERDASIQADHLHTIAFDTIMTGDVEKQLLAQKILDWIGNWS